MCASQKYLTLNITLFGLCSLGEVKFTDSHFDPSRHKLLEINGQTFFFKKIRPAGSEFEYHDILCELVCTFLGRKIDLPVVQHALIHDQTLGIGLLSPYLGDKTIRGVDPALIANSDMFPYMFIFEQWVMNIDDKADHFRLLPLQDKYHFYIVDHGHTLHA